MKFIIIRDRKEIYQIMEKELREEKTLRDYFKSSSNDNGYIKRFENLEYPIIKYL